MVVKIQVKVFWILKLWSVVVGYQCFRDLAYSIFREYKRR
jgi:predicted DCC family thiol-disulfide oxidoreductase YuxK